VAWIWLLRRPADAGRRARSLALQGTSCSRRTMTPDGRL